MAGRENRANRQTLVTRSPVEGSEQKKNRIPLHRGGDVDDDDDDDDCGDCGL